MFDSDMVVFFLLCRSYLKDLIETAHMFLKLLEHFCSNRNIVVQKRTVSRRQKKIRSEYEDMIVIFCSYVCTPIF